MAIELCDDRGKNLLCVEEDQEERERLKKMTERLGVDMYSLAQTEKGYAKTEDHFWGPECYERL